MHKNTRNSNYRNTTVNVTLLLFGNSGSGYCPVPLLANLLRLCLRMCDSFNSNEPMQGEKPLDNKIGMGVS